MVGRGRFIAFEGGEGCGKSTQAAVLAERLGALLTREPGGTPLGERTRAVLLDAEVGTVDPRAEALLMAGARAQHVSEVIEPALAAGTDVVADRFTGSTFAYQGYGRGLDVGELRGLSEWATGGLEPDLNVLLVASVPFGLVDPMDRLETAGVEFHRLVADGFAALAGGDPEHWVIVDGDGTVEEVAARVAASVGDRLSASL